MLLVALPCGRVRGMIERSARQPFVVLGTMEGDVLAALPERPVGETGNEGSVYFYETG